MSLAVPTLRYAFDYPVAAWGRRDLIQAHEYALDPRDGVGYLFVTQAAKPTAPGQYAEDLDIHRHRLDATGPTYLDTMRCRAFGHMQSLHVRISAAGNPWVWAPVERWIGNDLAGRDAARFMYEGGKLRTVRDGADRYGIVTNQYFTNSNQYPVSCPDWRFASREPKSDSTEIYRLWDERGLSYFSAPLKTSPRLPRPRSDVQPWQGSCVTEDSIFRLFGLHDPMVIIQNAWDGTELGRVDGATLLPPSGDGSVLGGFAEMEGATMIGGALHVGVKFGNTLARRRYSSFATVL